MADAVPVAFDVTIPLELEAAVVEDGLEAEPPGEPRSATDVVVADEELTPVAELEAEDVAEDVALVDDEDEMDELVVF